MIKRVIDFLEENFDWLLLSAWLALMLYICLYHVPQILQL